MSCRPTGTSNVYRHGAGQRGRSHPASVTPLGGSQPHENMQPYLCVSFIISLFGIFPTRPRE